MAAYSGRTRHSAAVTVMRRVDELDHAEVDRVFAGLERDGAAELAREGVTADRIAFVRQLDVRYVGQAYEVRVDVS